jgi:hypothetical protein
LAATGHWHKARLWGRLTKISGVSLVGRIADNASSETFGFNAQTEEYVDLLQAGIVDPAKVVRTALQGAASVAGLLVITEAMVADAPKKESPAPAMPGGGMTSEADQHQANRTGRLAAACLVPTGSPSSVSSQSRSIPSEPTGETSQSHKSRSPISTRLTKPRSHRAVHRRPTWWTGPMIRPGPPG